MALPKFTRMLPSLAALPAATSLLLSLASILHAQPPAATTGPSSELAGLAYDAPFFPGATYDPSVPTPDSVLGYPVGSRPAMHAEIRAVFAALADKSPRCKMFEYGTTHEGRGLFYMVIAAPERIAQLDKLKQDAAKLADPRTASEADANRLVDSTPAVAWMAYCIHGDEMSGSDACMAVAHHLAASTGNDVKHLLDNLIIIIDPDMNPDGRDRCITAVHQHRTVRPDVDDQSLIHSGVWPSGRMNHYLFDMNRDWVFGTQPESRGRIRAVSEWNPHYFMESHEMGSQDTFLFMPPRDPVNPHYPDNVRTWVSAFAKEQAAAFDDKGWRYYTGEWNEEWYPGYSSSWAAMRGAVENLYEQAAIVTDGVRRPEGVIESYREAVHKQLVSSMANLRTLALNRKQVVADFVAQRRRDLGADSPYAQRTFAITPSANASRLRAFLDLATLQGFEVSAAGAGFSASGKDRLGREFTDKQFPAGTILIPNRQPLARLLAAMYEFDTRMTTAFLTDERRELLRFDRSKLYDITGWSIPMLFDVECCELAGDIPAGADAKPWTASPTTPVAAAPSAQNAPSVGYVIDGADDGSVIAAARLMERAVWVRAADKPFEFGGQSFARGSLVITRKDNPSLHAAAGADPLGEAVRSATESAGVPAVPVRTGFGPGDLPDLGGEHFVLLHAPRVALIGGAPFGPYSYGQAWHTIDHVLGVRASYLDADQVGGMDLRRYNVIVLPEGGGSWIAAKMDALKPWVESGGTLIALGSSAAALATEKGIGSTRLVQDVLTKPDPYIQAVIREWEGRSAVADAARVWAFTPPQGQTALKYPWDGAGTGGGDEKPSEDELKRRDEWRRIFSPQGAIVGARVHDRSWITFGCGEYLPVLFSGSSVLAAPASVQTPIRLGVFNPAAAPLAEPEQGARADSTPASADSKPGDKKDEKKDEKKPKPGWTIAPPGYELRLRMSGLLWPEAAERMANSPYVTRESIGSGQVILFACDPNFRAASLGTQRLFSNAVVFGPGMGASQTIKP